MAERGWMSGLNLIGTSVALGAVLLWEIVVRAEWIAYDYFPAPSTIGDAAVTLTREGVLLPDLLHTLYSMALGWSISMAVGIMLGTLLGFSSTARRYSLASLEVLRPMPGIAFAPVALLLFGFSMKTELVVIVLPTMWPVMVNTMGGIANIQPRLVDVGRTLRLSRSEIVRFLLLPAAFPSIIVGARISLALALIMAIVAEIVGNPEGLGYGIVREQQALRPDTMFAYIAVVGILGVSLNAGVMRLTKAAWPSLVSRGAT